MCCLSFPFGCIARTAIIPEFAPIQRCLAWPYAACLDAAAALVQHPLHLAPSSYVAPQLQSHWRIHHPGHAQPHAHGVLRHPPQSHTISIQGSQSFASVWWVTLAAIHPVVVRIPPLVTVGDSGGSFTDGVVYSRLLPGC